MTIISPEELRVRLGAPDLRIVDTRWYLGQPGRGRAAYETGHLPGAIFLDLDTDLSAPDGPGRHPLPDPAAFARLLAERGIGDEHLVVAYDDTGGGVAARLWWMLDDLGHQRVSVLDGGLTAWTAIGGPLTTETPAWPPADLHLRAHWSRVIERDELRRRLGSLILLDARAPERYRGEVEPIDPAAGHIPTALSAPFTGNLGPDARFRSPGELLERFRQLGVGGDRSGGRAGSTGVGGGIGGGGGGTGVGGGVGGGQAERIVVTSCGSGTNACHNALAMRLAGLPDPLLYPGSFSDWSRSGLPVVTGPEPGEPA